MTGLSPRTEGILARQAPRCPHSRADRPAGREPSIGPDGIPPAAAHLTRNAVDCCPPGRSRGASREGRPLRVKLGLDPTAPDIHLGHTVVLQKLREFQDAGHIVVLIIGDYTARVGDPSGRSSTRPILAGEEIDANAAPTCDQAAKILARDERLEIRHNSRVARHAHGGAVPARAPSTVAQILERDDFARRWAAASRSRCSSCSTRAAGLRLGGRARRRRDRRHRPEVQPAMGREIQRGLGQPPQVVLTCRS